MTYERFRIERKVKRLRDDMEAAVAKRPELTEHADWHVWPEPVVEVTEEAMQDSLRQYSEQA